MSSEWWSMPHQIAYRDKLRSALDAGIKHVVASSDMGMGMQGALAALPLRENELMEVTATACMRPLWQRTLDSAKQKANVTSAPALAREMELPGNIVICDFPWIERRYVKQVLDARPNSVVIVKAHRFDEADWATLLRVPLMLHMLRDRDARLYGR